jgi:ribosomal protein L37AE/L43A
MTDGTWDAAQMHMTDMDMKVAEVGKQVRIGCHNCEGLEVHTKLANGKWKCNHCGAEDIFFE